MSSGQRIHVTQPELPPLDEFLPHLETIWSSRCLTNNGPFHEQLEKALCEYLEVPHLALFANGTLALMCALKALDIQGEVITTPYSFVATAHSLSWIGIRPVFVDIDSQTLNLDPGRIEAAITPQTTAILPVHCYGQPCDVDAIQAVADRHGLQVIYDAAHAFGVRCHCGSVLNHGDLSVLSFHATKVFNTFEGGAVVCRDAATKHRLDLLKNFGIQDEVTVDGVGINGKMNEFSAALGLLQLKGMDAALARRSAIALQYRSALGGIAGVRCLPPAPARALNHAYFPILVGQGSRVSRDELYSRLREEQIHARRYFYPLISSMPPYRDLPSAMPVNLPLAHRAAQEVLCLPIYPRLSDPDIDRIVTHVTRILQA